MTAAYDAYVKFINSEPEEEAVYDCWKLENVHFSKTYYFVDNNVALVAKDENGVEVTFEPLPLKSTNAENTNDLDQLASLAIPDVDNILDEELDRIPFGDKSPKLATYYRYHSDYLDEPADYVTYEMRKVPQQKGQFTVNMGVPDLNSSQTGEVFSFDVFPMLRSV